MRIIVGFVFWTVGVLLVIPAILGVFAGVAAMALTALVAFLLVVTAVAFLVLCCLPIVWWCAIFDTTRVYAYLNQLQMATKSQDAKGN